MFDKAWNPIKTLLLTGVCLTTLLAPYESEAAPKNRGRSERLSRKARREAERQNRQRKRQQRQRRASKPTFEENLSPAQVTRKIQTIRRRIETAPESVFPTKDKRVFLEVFDDMVQTPMGRYIFEKAHPDLTFRVRQTGEGVNGSYSYGERCVNLGRRIFDDIHNATTPEKRLYEKLYIAHVIAHETTHSIQHSNNMNNRSNMSVEEAVTIHKLLE
ncbi:MAG: hypothetical protein IJC30_00495, partial [Alphaproteobacteria bacterium]|nr:hypothetical protein [Alphaproteobacteria bacterium]